MKLLFLCIIYFVTISNGFTYEVEGKFSNISKNVSILEGESFNARISIWPMADEDLEKIKLSLKDSTFLDYFYIVNVENIQFSENNSDVVVANVKAVLVKAYEGKSVFIWTYKDLTIPFEIKDVLPIKNTLEKDFIILNQEGGFFNKSTNLWIIIFTIFCLLIIYIVGKKIFVKRNNKKRKEEIIQEWNTFFLNVKNRSDIESVYKKRAEWLDIIGGETPPIINFFKELNSVQYKKSWTDIEEHKILEAYDEIRGIFERS